MTSQTIRLPLREKKSCFRCKIIDQKTQNLRRSTTQIYSWIFSCDMYRNSNSYRRSIITYPEFVIYKSISIRPFKCYGMFLYQIMQVYVALLCFICVKTYKHFPHHITVIKIMFPLNIYILMKTLEKC